MVWENIELARGTGRSKKQAEVEAATAALQDRCWETELPATTRAPRAKKKTSP